MTTGPWHNCDKNTTRIGCAIWFFHLMRAPLLPYVMMKLCVSVTLKLVIAFQAYSSCLIMSMYIMPASILVGDVFYSNWNLMQQSWTLGLVRSSFRLRAWISSSFVLRWWCHHISTRHYYVISFLSTFTHCLSYHYSYTWVHYSILPVYNYSYVVH